MKNKSSSTLLGAALGFALLSAPAHGAITVLDSATGFNSSYQSSSISVSFSGLDLTGGDKLVVSIGAQSTGTGAGRNWSSVKFNDTAMTEAARIGGDTSSQFQSGVYYLDLGASPSLGNLTVSATTLNVRGLSATAWVLSGTAAGHGASGASAGASTALITTAANSWVLSHATVGGTTAPTAQSPLTPGLQVVNPYNGSAETSIGTGYQTVATSGTSLTPTFDSGATTVAAEFTVIPEPSTALLGALGLLALLRRRR